MLEFNDVLYKKFEVFLMKNLNSKFDEDILTAIEVISNICFVQKVTFSIKFLIFYYRDKIY